MNSAVYALAESALFRATPLQLVLGALLLIQLGRVVLRRLRFVHSVSWITGPAALPIVGNALSLTGGQDEFYRLLLRCVEEYGRVFRLWIGTRIFVFIGRAEDIQPILSSMQHIDKSYEYGFLHDWLGQGLITATGPAWQMKRKLLTPSFHSNILDDFAEPISRQTDTLLGSLERFIKSEEVFDVVPFLKRCTLDIICEFKFDFENLFFAVTAMGKEVGAQAGRNNEYVAAVEGISEIVQKRFVTPWIKPEFLFKMSNWGRRQEKTLAVIKDFVGQVIKAKITERNTPHAKLNGIDDIKSKRTFLNLLLDQKDNGADLTDEEIEDEVNTFMFAGHDTTAIAVSWCLYVLGKHPEMQKEIVSEFQREIQPDQGVNQQLKKLQILDNCIKEVLRLYPVAPIIARNITQAVQLSDGVVPAGTTALILPAIVHRDPRFFPEPNAFQPQRFQQISDITHPFAYIPFSAGPRNCIGQRFAQMSTKLLVGKILERFEVESVDSEDQLNLVPAIVLTNKDGINIKLRPRNL